MKKMRDFIFGFLAGIIVMTAFLYGPGYMVVLGNKTEEVGKRLESYKKPVRDTARNLLMNI